MCEKERETTRERERERGREMQREREREREIPKSQNRDLSFLSDHGNIRKTLLVGNALQLYTLFPTISHFLVRTLSQTQRKREKETENNGNKK